MKHSIKLTQHLLCVAAAALASTSGFAQNAAPGNYNGAGATSPASPASPTSDTGPTSSSATGKTADTTPLPTEPTGAGYASSGYSGADSWLPYTTAGYIGLSVGNGKLNTACVAGQSCDDPNGAVSIYTGGMFSPYFGIQLGYFQLGNADRNGDTTKVSGVNLVLTGLAPLGSNFSLVGRLGTTYGWTKTSVGLGVPAASGDANGFGASYGVGLDWAFTRNWSATLDWDRHHLKYAGDQRENTDVATIGLKYRF